MLCKKFFYMIFELEPFDSLWAGTETDENRRRSTETRKFLETLRFKLEQMNEKPFSARDFTAISIVPNDGEQRDVW